MEKKYTSLKEFYPYYLTEHQNPTSRVLHFIGTGLVLVVLGAAIAMAQYIWLAGIFLLLFAPIPVWRYPALACNDELWRDQLLAICLTSVTGVYILIRILKKSGRFTE